MNCKPKNPIVLISGFKAGTWLMRKMITSITSMNFFEPTIIPGERKYYNSEQLQFVKKHFYSWHLVPTQEVIQKLNEHDARTIFVVRNVYDVVVSIYYHFINNIDADIGRANNKDSFLREFTFDEGISLIISGFDENGLRWNGMSEVLLHYNEIFKASQQCSSLIVEYNRLVQDKESVVKEIVSYLDCDMEHEELNSLVSKTSFAHMKNEALKSGRGSSHFREGRASSNREKLSECHKVQLRQIIKVFTPNLYKNARVVQMQSIVEQ